MKKRWSHQNEETVDLYRLYNPNTGEYFYIVNVYERNILRSSGWCYEGMRWVVALSGAFVLILFIDDIVLFLEIIIIQ